MGEHGREVVCLDLHSGDGDVDVPVALAVSPLGVPLPEFGPLTP